MDKPRIFLGSSGKQEKLLQALTRGLGDIAHVEPWTTSFNPGTSTLERLLELTREVDFAAFVFAQDDWTTSSPSASSQPQSGQASPRDNVVFEAGLFGGVLGMRRTFILHARRSEASERPPRPYMRALRRRDDAVGDEDHQPESPQSNRERRPHDAHRGRMVAVLIDRAHRKGAFRAEPPEDFARSQRRAGVVGPFMAGGWKPLGEILERGGEGEGRVFRHLLLLEGRATAGSECAAARRSRRDPAGIRRPRIRLLHDARGFGSAA